MKKGMFLYQLLDSLGEPYGLIISNAPEEHVQEAWKKYFLEAPEPSHEEFSQLLEDDGYKSEVIWCTLINC